MQDTTDDDLTRCFREVFPNIRPADIPAATQEGMADWDSVAQVTLLSLIGEVFNIEIDFEAFAEATSFAAILNLIRVAK
jgi:acyl carrier protein